MKYLHVTGLIIFLFFSTTKLLAQAVINTGFVAGHMSTCNGSESEGQEIQFFTISASGLTDNITAKISPGFELSLDEYTGFSGSITIPQSNGLVSTTVYVRLTGGYGPGVVSGSAVLTSGAATKSVTVTGTVRALPTVIKPGDQIVLNGDTTLPVYFIGTGNYYTWINDTPSIGLSASGADSIPSFTAVNNGTTPITANITVTPQLAELAYVTIPDSNQVVIINTMTDKVSTTIKSGGPIPAPEVLSPDYSDLYVVNSAVPHGGGNVVKINTANNAKLNSYVINAGSFIVLSPDGGTIYLATVGTIYVINTISNQIITKIPISDTYFTGLAMSPLGDRVYASSNFGKIYVISTATNTITTTLNTVVNPGMLSVSPDGSILYAANAPIYDLQHPAPNILYIINTSNYETITKLNIGEEPCQIAVSPDGKRLYISTSYPTLTGVVNSQVYVINTTNNSVVQTIGVGNLPEGVSVTPDGSKVYVANSGEKTVSVINTSNNSIITTIPVKGNPGATAVAFGGCDGTPQTFTITVNPAPLPSVNTTNNLTALTTVYGTASALSSFTISATALRSGILVTPPKGFEVSSDNTNFSKTVTIGAAGNLSFATVYIRLASTTPVGPYSGNIVLSGRALQPINIAMPLSTVSPAPLTITADNKFKIYGQPNPVLTVSYSGFVNNDGPNQLTSPPVTNTTAGTSSSPGRYPITVKGATSPNYTITFVPGVLTITHGLNIPNAFTPNGDGINDTWFIQNIIAYPNCSVMIYNRYGENVFSSIGYGKPWDGTYKGFALPTGTYYYIIDLKTGVDVFSGFVSIIR